MMRLLLIVGVVRLLVRSETRGVRWNALDASVALLALVLVIAGTAKHGTVSVLVNRLGQSFDILATYLFMRVSLRTSQDLLTTIYAGVGALAVLAAFMALEWTTGRNLFSHLGAVPAITWIRDGRLRCQGAFGHPIMAGVFGASWLPLLVSLWWFGRKRVAIGGVCASLLVVFFSSSSTPVLGALVAGIGLALWPARMYMRHFRWSVLALLVFLHFAREKPVWHLLSRVNILDSSTGWHRFWVVDQAIRHFGEWWLAGTSDITHWHIHWNDITNQYVGLGLNGGIWATGLLIANLTYGFAAMGRAARSRAFVPAERRLAWALGVTLAIHMFVFLAVVYFGQMTFVWHQQLAMVGTMTQYHRDRIGQLRRSLRSRLAPDAQPGHSEREAPAYPVDAVARLARGLRGGSSRGRAP
jgi:hypothetical protein